MINKLNGINFKNITMPDLHITIDIFLMFYLKKSC